MPGIAIAGKDAAFIRNQPDIGMVVTGDLVYDDPGWSTLFFVNVNDKRLMESIDVEKTIENALLAGKAVAYVCKASDVIPTGLMDLQQLYPEMLSFQNNILLPNNILSPRTPVEVPVILVGGLIKEADTTDLLLGLTTCMRNNGIRPLVLSDYYMGELLGFHDVVGFSQLELSNDNRIGLLRRIIRELSDLYRPDVILMEAPDAVMEFSSDINNGYGIDTYLLCTAVRPDYFVCCVPFNLANSESLDKLSDDFTVRLGSPISVVHLSNIFIDTSTQFSYIDYVFLDNKTVKERLASFTKQDLVPMFDVIGDGADELFVRLNTFMGE